MKKPSNRKALVISAVLTALFLALGGTAVLAWDRLSAVNATKTASAEVVEPVSLPAAQAPVVNSPTPVDSGQALSDNSQALALEQANAEIAAYRAQLEQASRALNDAYAQITSLQAAQNQPLQGQFLGEQESREHGRVFSFRGGGDD